MILIETFLLESAFDIAVIVASPSPTASMLPFSSTLTTVSSLDSYVTPFSVASSGVTVTVIFSLSPISRSNSVLSASTFSTGTTGFLTLTLIETFLLESAFDVAVIVASPSPTASRLPFSSTLTTSSLLDLYVTPFSVASSGVTVTVIFSLSPISRSISSLSTVIPSTGTVTLTGISIALSGLPLGVIVIVASPPPTAVTLPFSSTLTTSSLLDLYVTPLSVASSGVTVTVILSFPPLLRLISVLFTVIPSTGTIDFSKRP